MKTKIIILLILCMSVSCLTDLAAQNVDGKNIQTIEIENIENQIRQNETLLKNQKKLKTEKRIEILEQNNEKKDIVIEFYKTYKTQYETLINELDSIEKELKQKEFFFSEDTDVFEKADQPFDFSKLPQRQIEFVHLIRTIRQIEGKLDKIKELIDDNTLTKEDMQDKARGKINEIDDEIFNLREKEQIKTLLSEKQFKYYTDNIINRYNKYYDMIY